MVRTLLDKKWIVIGTIILSIFFIMYYFGDKEEISALELDASYYECEPGTMMTTEKIPDVNDNNIEKYLCYVKTGIKASCPMDVETKQITNSLGNSCNLVLNQTLTNIRGENIYFYMPLAGSSVSQNTTLNQACLDRNYVHTDPSDTEYYGYYKTACVCYGSYENVAQCGNRQWLNKEVSDSDYRYYIQTQDDMVCDNGGTPIVIGNGGEKKGDLYACSLSAAKLKKLDVVLNFSFSDNNYLKSSMNHTFEVSNGGDTKIVIEDKNDISSIFNAGYELDEKNTVCKDVTSNVYNGSIINGTFVVDGSNLSDTVRFLEDVTCDFAFKRKSHTVKVILSDESTGNAAITSTYNNSDNFGNYYVTDGDDISINATADGSSKYVSTTCEAFGANVKTSTNLLNNDVTNITFSNVKDDIICSVTFLEKEEYKLEASVVGGKGTVSPSSSSYYEGTKPKLNLTPSTGYSIDTSKTTCDNIKYYIFGSQLIATEGIKSDVKCDIYYKAVDYNISITPNPTEGAKDISVIYNNDIEDTNPNYGDEAVVTVKANEGYSYGGNTCGNNGSEIKSVINTDGSHSFSFFVTGNKNCEVKFDKVNYKVSAKIISDTGTGNIKVGNSSVEHGGSTTIDIFPDVGYLYDSERTICTGNGNIIKEISPINISNISSDINCNIALKLNKYNVNVTSNDLNMGHVEQNMNEVTIKDKVVVVINPNEGYEYEKNDCGINGSEIETKIDENGKLIFEISDISTSLSCQVSFKNKQYKVNTTVNPSDGGTVNISSDVVNHGNDTSITLFPNVGYEFDSYLCKNSSNLEVSSVINDSKNSIILNDVTSDINCDINYKLKEYDINVTYTPIDSVVENSFKVEFDDDNDNGKVKHGQNVFINYELKDGYSYSGNTCGATVYGENQLILGNVNSDIDNCIVTFVENAYKVIADVDGEGGSVVVEPGAVGYLGSSTIRAFANSGYVYDSENTTCVGNGNIIKENENIEITNIKSDIECSVAFKLEKYTVDVLIESNDIGGGEILNASYENVTKNDNLEIIVKPNIRYEYEYNTCGIKGESVEAIKNEQTGEWIFTISNVTDNKTCYVGFKKILNVSAKAINGKIDKLIGDIDNSDGSVDVYENKNAEILISPNDNYVYGSNNCGAIPNSDNSKLTITNIVEDKICEVKFIEKVKHKVEISSANNSYGLVGPSVQEVFDLSDAKVNVDVTDGNEYLNVVCNGNVVNNAIFNNNELIIPGVISDLVCVVNYKDVGEYVIKANTSNQEYGSVTPDNQTIDNGGQAIISVIPNEGYEYESNDCGAKFNGRDMLTLENVTSNKTCIVNFKERIKFAIDAKVSDNDAGSVVVKDEFVYSGENSTIVVVPNIGYEYESNDCGAEYNNGLLFLNNVTSDKICTINFKSNFDINVGGIDDDIVNVPTGDKKYIIFIISVIGIIGIVFGYKNSFNDD